jgi:hypothetical protein
MPAKVLVEFWNYEMTECKRHWSVGDLNALAEDVAMVRSDGLAGRLMVHVPGSIAYEQNEKISTLGVQIF